MKTASILTEQRPAPGQEHAGRDRYVLVKGASGLGNRMLCVLSGILYARLAHRKLVVDWTDPLYCDGSENLFERFFQSPLAGERLGISARSSVRPQVWMGHLDTSVVDLVWARYPKRLGTYSSFRLTSVDMQRVDYPQRVLVMWSWDDQIEVLRRHFRGEFAPLRNLSTWQILRTLAAEHLVLAPEIRQRVDEFKAEHWRGEMVGVHVRYTDQKCPLARYHRHLARLLKRRPGCRIFLATDNARVSEEFSRQYPNLVVREKEFCGDGKPIHLDYTHPHRLARAVDALVEMYLLAECHRLIYARRSTYSYMAHILSSIPDENIIDIDRYNPVCHLRRFIQQRIVSRMDVGRWVRAAPADAGPSSGSLAHEQHPAAS